MTWDYVIVGAGAAGAVVANRLSADPAIRVLLIEPGGEDRKLRCKLPAMCVDCVGNPDSDWMSWYVIGIAMPASSAGRPGHHWHGRQRPLRAMWPV